MSETRFLSQAERAKTIELEWPIEFEGRAWHRIVVKRLNAREVADFTEKILKREDKDSDIALPVFRDEEGKELPVGLLDALDADDRDVLNEAALSFLPRRFRGAAASASVPADGAATA